LVLYTTLYNNQSFLFILLRLFLRQE